MATREEVYYGLLQRGLPDYAAQGIVMNLEDESGLDTGINEIAPLVPGSRGGYGLAQWTGPRRVALEQYAAQSGAPADDLDTQLDFLMTELKGPESRAYESLMASGNAGDAGAAFVTDFLRPAAQHRERRVAEYQGSTPPFFPEGDNALRGKAREDDRQERVNAILAAMQQRSNAPMQLQQQTGFPDFASSYLAGRNAYLGRMG